MRGFSRIVFDSDSDELETGATGTAITRAVCTQCGKTACFCIRGLAQSNEISEKLHQHPWLETVVNKGNGNKEKKRRTREKEREEETLEEEEKDASDGESDVRLK